MKTYRTFEEYMYDNYYDAIYNKVNGFLFQNKGTSFLSTNLIPDVSRFELDDYHVAGVTFNTPGGDALHFRLSINADVNVYGKSRYDYESDTKSVWMSVYFESILKNGLHGVRIVRVEEYSKDRFDKETALDHYLVPYLYSEDGDKVAEEFLRELCPQALDTAMPLPVDEIVENMGMICYPAPLEDNIFGKTYFVTSTVTVYKDDSYSETEDITIPPGTMLINPYVSFMYNIGTMNNTIIHECVHWKRHKMFFELMRLLNNDCSSISCEIIESYGRGKENSSPLDWIEWQANYLAPKILMPASTTKKFIQDRLHNLRQCMPASTRDAEVMAQAIQDTADFFQVSRLAAKIRAIELGIVQAKGVFVYVDGRYIPPFSFSSTSLGKNDSFVIENFECLREILINNNLFTLWESKKIVFVNNMLCVNNSKYVTYKHGGHAEMTEYALDHVDECCFIFSLSLTKFHCYDDDFYYQCFLCHELTLDSSYIYKYRPENKETEDANLYQHNQKVEALASEIDSTPDFDDEQQQVIEHIDHLSFGESLKYLMESVVGMPVDVLEYRSQVSHTEISGLRNGKVVTPRIETLLKIFVGLHLNAELCEILLQKAKIEYPIGFKGRLYKWLVRYASGREYNLIDWQLILDKKITSPEERITLFDPNYENSGAMSKQAKEALKRDAIAFYKAGHTYEETAAHFGSSKSTVQRWVKDAAN